MIKNASNAGRPTKAQRAAQSARDKRIAAARASSLRAPRKRMADSSNAQAPKRQRRSGLGGVPPVAGFFAPVAEGTIMKSVRPVFQRSSFKSQRIIHREKVSKLTTPGDGSFKVLGSFALNPGLASVFPWLSNEAQGWEMYRFNRLRFIWVPTSGTSVAGNIIMAPDYDAADAAPIGETFMSSYTDAEEANVWCRFASELSPDLLNGEMKRKFIRTSALASNLDIKTYDSGNFFVVSADDAVANSGKLWVEYDIELYNPQVPSGGFQAGSALAAGSSLTSASPFGTNPVNTGSIGVSASGKVFTLSGVVPGQEVSVMIALSGTAITACSLAATTGCTGITTVSAIDGAATDALVFETYKITAQSPTFTLTLTATTVTSAYLTVVALAPIPSF